MRTTRKTQPTGAHERRSARTGPSTDGDERDEAGEERDQAADKRDDAGRQRDKAGEQRDRAGVRRDEDGEQRDLAGDERDRAGIRRDRAAQRSEARAGAGLTAVLRRTALARRLAAADRQRAKEDREAGASQRTEAEQDRKTALADRGAGASERTEAGRDRRTAFADRGASASDRHYAAFDDLTGAYLRGPGFMELEREVLRARRTGQPLVVAFIDVDGLKAINDSRGHVGGDRMLLEIVNMVRAKLRSYDLMIRVGGDEFVCVIPGVSIADATTRFAAVNANLAEVSGRGSITAGIAQLRDDDSPAGLVARADAALYESRQQKGRPHS